MSRLGRTVSPLPSCSVTVCCLCLVLVSVMVKVTGGVASAPGYEEVVAATYTGNLFALSSVPSGSAASAGARRLNTDTCARLAKLKTEIDELQVTDKTKC